MRLLITGASGLLGLRIAELADERGYEVYSAYNKHSPQYGVPIKMDLTNEDACAKAFKIIEPEVVIHAAAMTNVDLCETDKEMAWSVNVLGTETIAKLCKEYGSFLIFISTDYLFNGEKGLYSEEDSPSPINYYGYTKLKAEEVVKRFLTEYCIVRTSVIFGSRPAAEKINFVLWVLESLRQGKRINIVTDQINSPTLNTSLAKMLLEVAERRLTGIYHLAGATPISRYEFAKLLANEFNLDQNLIQPTTSDKINWTAKRPKNTSLNVAKAAESLKEKPLTIQESVKELRRELERNRR